MPKQSDPIFHVVQTQTVFGKNAISLLFHEQTQTVFWENRN
jgi:hypothetical protein